MSPDEKLRLIKVASAHSAVSSRGSSGGASDVFCNFWNFNLSNYLQPISVSFSKSVLKKRFFFFFFFLLVMYLSVPSAHAQKDVYKVFR